MKLYVIGFGPGNKEGMTLEAERALQESDLIVGYTVYVELLKEMFPLQGICFNCHEAGKGQGNICT